MFTAVEETPWPRSDFFFGASGLASESGFAVVFPRRAVFRAFFAVVLAATGDILACLRFDGAGRTAARGRWAMYKETAMRRMILCFLLLVYSATASAETPFQFAAPNHQSPEDPNVNGVRISILHGENESVRGLDLGLLSLSETSDLSGLSLVLGMGKVTGAMSGGAAISLINLHTGSDAGLNAAFINRIHSAERAVDVGFVNIADGATMVDVGGLNVSDSSRVQLGFLNVTKKITGAQVGFLNIAENGFLPVFPIFNFPKN
jgi:hypothetical protein